MSVLSCVFKISGPNLCVYLIQTMHPHSQKEMGTFLSTEALSCCQEKQLYKIPLSHITDYIFCGFVSYFRPNVYRLTGI